MVVEVSLLMLATMEIIDILQQADGLAEMILHSEIGKNTSLVYINYKATKRHSGKFPSLLR